MDRNISRSWVIGSLSAGIVRKDSLIIFPNHDRIKKIIPEGELQMDLEQDVWELVNQERVKEGLDVLEWSEGAAKAARMKAEDLWNKRYFDHFSPVYGTPAALLRRVGVSFTGVGENLGQGPADTAQMMAGWMGSDGHRANILHRDFTHLGVGVFKVPEKDSMYWTQLFISVSK